MDAEEDKEQIKFRFIIIPDFIIQDTSIPDGEKLLFGEIASNSLEKGFCWFSNQYLMNRFNISDRTTSRWIYDLRKKGYITVEIIRRKGSSEIDERKIRIDTTKPILAEYMNWFGQKRRQGIANIGNTPPVKIGGDNNRQCNNKELISLKDITNIFLTKSEYQNLIDEFGTVNFESGLNAYSKWKLLKHAHTKSDFDSLRKWLSKAQNKYKGRVSSVKESRADEVTDEMLENLPF